MFLEVIVEWHNFGRNLFNLVCCSVEVKRLLNKSYLMCAMSASLCSKVWFMWRALLWSVVSIFLLQSFEKWLGTLQFIHFFPQAGHFVDRSLDPGIRCYLEPQPAQALVLFVGVGLYLYFECWYSKRAARTSAVSCSLLWSWQAVSCWTMPSSVSRWLGLARMSVCRTPLCIPRMNWSWMCNVSRSNLQDRQANSQSIAEDTRRTTKSLIDSLGSCVSELKCIRCTLGLDFWVTMVSMVFSKSSSGSVKKSDLVLIMVVCTLSAHRDLVGIAVMFLYTVQSTLNFLNWGQVISAAISGALAMVGLMNGDGLVANEGCACLACWRIVRMSPMMVMSRSVINFFVRSGSNNSVTQLSWKFFTYVAASVSGIPALTNECFPCFYCSQRHIEINERSECSGLSQKANHIY